MCSFSKKSYKNRRSVGDSAPTPSGLLLPPTIISLSNSFLTLNCFITIEKEQNN